VAFARSLVAGLPPGDRLARISTVFRFVAALAEAHGHGAQPTDAVDFLLDRLGERRGPAVVLGALLLALGERTHLECTRELTFVSVAVEPADLRRLPPHARLVSRHARLYLTLDPRRARSPFGFLPAAVREAVASRRRAGPALRLPS
jgi:hypothetical protein